MKPPDRDWLKHRLMGAGVCIILVFILLFLRLIYLQVIKGEEFRRLSETNCIRLKSIKPFRGMIFDRNKKLLVDNRPSFNLNIILEDAKPLDRVKSQLDELINLPGEELDQIIDKAPRGAFYKPLLIKKDISREELAIIEAHKFDLPGIHIDIEPHRHYLYKKSAAHLLGYLGQINVNELKSGKYPGVNSGDAIGRYGTEKSFETFLRGKRGGRQVEVDASGRIIKVLKTVEPLSGNDLYLALDLELQQVAEAFLEGERGAVVAMDPSNGDVLVMASSPSFDLNDFIGGISSKKWKTLISDPGKPMTNKAIQGVYPPASTYKIVTALAALEEKIIDPSTTFFCPGQMTYGNRVYRCWNKHGHGEVNVTQALTESCDVFFYIVGDKLGVDVLAQYAKGCGLGKSTRVNLDNELRGLIPTASWKKKRYNESWQGGETLSIAIGQGFNLVTPLQMCVLTAAVGNGGTLYRPRILKSVEAPGGQVVKQIETEIIGGLPASKETLAIVKKGLLGVVEGVRGTARKIRMKEVQIAGKTGTAQVFSIKQGEKVDMEKLKYTLKDHAWFVAYAPAKDPVIAVSVIIEHGEHGSTAAAPVARAVIEKCLEQKGIVEKKTE
ncbi:MAG: penicillin-binding protein 2 [Desulfobacteraceae bacterium]|nr:MAG: penicillin-binding protein 2 [Desulfobacteraceae bacterium]